MCVLLPDRMGFEINVLGQQMNQMLDSMVAHQQEAEREKMARERLAQELQNRPSDSSEHAPDRSARFSLIENGSRLSCCARGERRFL